MLGAFARNEEWAGVPTIALFGLCGLAIPYALWGFMERFCNSFGPIAVFLSEHAYAAYLIHPWIVVLSTYAAV